MPQIKPFKGVLYNSKKVDSPTVVAPPYDVISPQMQDELYRANEYNIIRLILGKEEAADSKRSNKYKRANQFFTKWLNNKILIRDTKPSIYVYNQEYFHKDKKKVRLGFIARMRIEDPRKSKVLPHEYTFAKPKQDRLQLIRETKANLSPIFTLFQDEGNQVISILKGAIKKRPIFDIEYEGVRNKVWRLADKGSIKKIQAVIDDKDIYIADGHHRYEVAVSYRDEMRKKQQRQKGNGYNYVMMYLSPLNQKGVTIFSTHRLIRDINMGIKEVLKRLKPYFYIKAFKSGKRLFEEMVSAKVGNYVFGMYVNNKTFYLLKLKRETILDDVLKDDHSKERKRLDVSILHGLVLDHIIGLRKHIQDEDNIIYTRDPNYAINMVDKGNCQVAFFLNPTKVHQVQSLAKKGHRMPHKSTYFYPKLLSGLVINKLG